MTIAVTARPAANSRGLVGSGTAGRGTVELAPGLKINGERHEERAVGRLNQGGRSFRVYTARGTVRLSGR